MYYPTIGPPPVQSAPIHPEAAALRVLMDHLGMQQRFLEMRRYVAQCLLQQFVGLLQARITVQPDAPFPSEVRIPLDGGAAVTVHVDGATGGLSIIGPTGERQSLPLVFNPESNLFEGTEVDPEVMAIPGQPLPRREAMKVLVEAVFNPPKPPRKRK